MNAPASSTGPATRLLLDFAFRFRVPLTWTVAIAGFILARPTDVSIVLGAAWAAVGLGWRAWAAGVIRKNAELATDGPYGLSRHPLYFGNLMLASGFAAASGRIAVLAAVMALAAAIYLPLIRDEEAALIQLFGERYREYIGSVPCLLPTFRGCAGLASHRRFSWCQYMANHEYNAALGYCAGVAALVVLHLLRQR